ncbi:MAPEG family protein [Brevirhabdus sp.]|uniref:MAPEG family protein n=1 Tax=Brevirhabdus sp. TaxID=2004514 RepID=UPI004058F39C
MTPQITAFSIYAGLLGLLLCWIVVAVIRIRIRLQISYGDGGEKELLRAMRGQSNFAETVPLALILMLSAALMGAPVLAIHGLGVLLVLGRILHFHAFFCNGPLAFRQAGMALTLTALALSGAGTALYALL